MIPAQYIYVEPYLSYSPLSVKSEHTSKQIENSDLDGMTVKHCSRTDSVARHVYLRIPAVFANI